LCPRAKAGAPTTGAERDRAVQGQWHHGEPSVDQGTGHGQTGRSAVDHDRLAVVDQTDGQRGDAVLGFGRFDLAHGERGVHRPHDFLNVVTVDATQTH
jgi:hypothetical protein